MGFIKYRLVDMYKCHLFQIESMQSYKRGKVFISFVNDNKVIYNVNIGSFSYIEFEKGKSDDGSTTLRIRLDGDDRDKRNRILTIKDTLTDLDKKVFHKSMEVYVSQLHNIANEDTSPRITIDINSI